MNLIYFPSVNLFISYITFTFIQVLLHYLNTYAIIIPIHIYIFFYTSCAAVTSYASYIQFTSRYTFYDRYIHNINLKNQHSKNSYSMYNKLKLSTRILNFNLQQVFLIFVPIIFYFILYWTFRF